MSNVAAVSQQWLWQVVSIIHVVGDWKLPFQARFYGRRQRLPDSIPVRDTYDDSVSLKRHNSSIHKEGIPTCVVYPILAKTEEFSDYGEVLAYSSGR